MSWSRFILRRGFDCHVRVIDCSKDRGKSRNVITVLLRLVPPPGNQWEVKRDIDLWAAKSVAWDNRRAAAEGGVAQTCHWQPTNYPISSEDTPSDPGELRGLPAVLLRKLTGSLGLMKEMLNLQQINAPESFCWNLSQLPLPRDVNASDWSIKMLLFNRGVAK